MLAMRTTEDPAASVARKPDERSWCCSCGPLIRHLVDKPVHDTVVREGESRDRLSAVPQDTLTGGDSC
jgi:hypothetical protein